MPKVSIEKCPALSLLFGAEVRHTPAFNESLYTGIKMVFWRLFEDFLTTD